MKVKELIEKLQEFDGELEVYTSTSQYLDMDGYGMTHSVESEISHVGKMKLKKKDIIIVGEY